MSKGSDLLQSIGAGKESIAAVEKEFDFSERYTVAGWSDGIGWYAFEFATEQTEEFISYCGEDCADADTDCDCGGFWDYDIVQDRTRVKCCMVGDDQVYTFGIDELTLVDGEVCSCGQIGCGW